MRLESLDGFGACSPKEKKQLTYVLPSAQIKSMGLTSTAAALDQAKIPYVQTGNNIVAKGQTLPNFIDTKNKAGIVASLQEQATPTETATVAAQATEATTTTLTPFQKKAIGITALALLAMAALANQFKSKPGGMSGISTPRKKMAVAHL